MSLNFVQTIKDAIAHLNPSEIREQATRPVRIGLYAQSEKAYQQMEAYFAPASLSAARKLEAGEILQRASLRPGETFDIPVYGGDQPAPHGAFRFDLDHPERTVQEILNAHPNFSVALARRIEPFREPVSHFIVKKISKENALFSLATAIPDIMPFLTLPWAVGEFASDTAVLTANQVRMAFLLAAANDRLIGYGEQKAELASILVGAFGWRAIARELVGKIPFGGGLIPKAAVAYAGTRVAGLSLEKYYRVGYGFTQSERRVAYDDAYERGKTIAGSLLHSLKHRQLSR